MYSRFLLSCTLLSYCSSQIRHLDHHIKGSLTVTVQQCPTWSFHSEKSKKCECFSSKVKCSDNGSYFKVGYCASYDNDTGIVSYAPCPYFQSNGFNINKFDDGFWYIPLPENVSELNNYMCGTMSRSGRVCSKCADGFGPAVMSVGFEIQCSQCIGAWYGMPLYLFLELCPVTIFYLILLIFQINITSAPITSYIMYSQILVIATDRIFSGETPILTGIMISLSKPYKRFAKVILSIYDVWNLRFFRYFMSSFCISSQLKPIHVAFLGYISVFYPLCLIILTWVCVEVHDRNFRPIVWLWRPFHRCFIHLRRGWNTKNDIIGVFASFFLLSFSKGLYQVVLLMIDQKIDNRLLLQGTYLYQTHVVNLDLNMTYGSTEHLIFAIPAIFISCIFNILPTLLLLFYPIGLFRACLSKFKLDGIALYFFVEKFYGCYRNGLDGGKDMRSFAGLSFVLRVMLFFTNAIGSELKISNNDPYFTRNIAFTVALLLISLCRPYKYMYMNVLDVLLLAHLGLLCHLLTATSYQGFRSQTNAVFAISVMVSLPFAGFMLLILAKTFIKAQSYFHTAHKKCKQLPLFSSTKRTHSLVEPTVAEISHGTIH